jgi:large subunit ribosomal protein L10
VAEERRIEKVMMADYASGIVRESDYVYFITYIGIDVAGFSDFRNKLVDMGVECKVMKNSFIGLGLGNSDIELPDGFSLTGDTAVVFGHGDPCPPAKVIKEFGKAHECISFKAAVVDGSLVSAQQAQAVADLPSKEVLQAQLLGIMLAPAQNLLNLLNQSVAQFVDVIKAYQDKLEKES